MDLPEIELSESERPTVDHWVPCGTAFRVLAHQFSELGGGDADTGRASAASILASELASGAIRARGQKLSAARNEHIDEACRGMAETYSTEPEIWKELILRGVIDATGEPLNTSHQLIDLNPTFWLFLRESGLLGIGQKPVPAPDEYGGDWGIPAGPTSGYGWVIGQFPDEGWLTIRNVQFALCDLPCQDAVRAVLGLDQPGSRPAERRRSGGPKPSKGWAPFMAELGRFMEQTPGWRDWSAGEIYAELCSRTDKRCAPPSPGTALPTLHELLSHANTESA